MDWDDKNYTQWAIAYMKLLFLKEGHCIPMTEEDESLFFTDVEVTGDAGAVRKNGKRARAMYELNMEVRWKASKHIDKKFKIETTGSTRFLFSSEEEHPDINVILDKIIVPQGAGPGFKNLCKTMQKTAKNILPDIVRKMLAPFSETLVEKVEKEIENKKAAAESRAA